MDTNVVSELMRPRPATQVLNRLDARMAGDLCLTAVIAAELTLPAPGLKFEPPAAAKRRRLKLSPRR
ncbi:MAG: hypothetical protein EBY28_06490 [Betaproteobacteria bacterium]|nr:hypothetical protein [Betaproteobacteria bacterium]